MLGPLVVGGFLWEAGQGFDPLDPTQQAALRRAGAADSKALSPKRRAAALTALAPLGLVRTVELSARQIDEGNLNQLEEQAFLDLARELRPQVLYLDAPVHPRAIPALRERLARALDPGTRFVIEPKADATWPVVGAASIAAKLRRDAALADCARQAGQPLGSGYPSDPLTRAWLADRLASGVPLPPFVRQRWATLEELRAPRLFG